MLRRLLALVVSVALIGLAAVVIGRIVLVPVAEGRIEDAVGRTFGAPADADLDPPLGLALLGGAVGDVRVRLDEVVRQAVTVRDVDVRIAGAEVDVRTLIDGRAEVRFTGIAFTGTVTEATLTGELRRRLLARRVPGAARAVVDVTADGVRVRVPEAQPVAVAVRAASRGLRVEATGTDPVSAAVAEGLRGPLPLGRLPYGIRVTKVRPVTDALVVSGGRGPGAETL
jgi:hypothetical protein